MRLKKHYVHTKARGDLWDAHRVDRDRTTERIELGLRVHEALMATRCTHTEVLPDRERRCVKPPHVTATHIMATMTTLLDRVGLPMAEEANA